MTAAPPIFNRGHRETPRLTLKKFVNAGPLFAVMLLWGVHLGYPLQSLQHIRRVFFGQIIPVYYFFVVLPMAGAAALTLSFKRNWRRWELAWWLLPLICLPGILQSDDRIWSVRQWLSWIIRGVIPGGILFISYRKTNDFMLLRWIYPIIIGASLLGLWELYYDRNPLWENRMSSDIHLDIAQPQNNFVYRPHDSFYRPIWWWRPGGTQGNRIAYASILVGFLPLGVWLLKYKKKFYFMPLSSVGILFSILVLARARSAWIGMSAAMMAMKAVGLQRERRETLKIAAGALLCVGVFLAWPQTRQLLRHRLNSFQLAEPSIRVRLEFLQTARILKDHGFIGVGFGQFPTVCRPYSPSKLDWNGTPENQYLRWAIENGMPGLGLLGLFFVGLVRAGWKKIQAMKDIRQADFYKSLLAGWVGVAVTFLFFDGFYWGACNMTFWCLLGLFATCLSSEGAGHSSGAIRYNLENTQSAGKRQ